jgi:uncharacterized membrane protein (UPF0127 family)
VKLTCTLTLALLAAVLTGCNKDQSGSATAPANPAAGSATSVSANPQQVYFPMEAQPRLTTVKTYLGAETLDAELAITPEEDVTGLMYRTNITDDTAMLFNLHVPERASFWMTNCPMSLSCAYINPDGVIEEIHHLEKNDNVPVLASNSDILYALEVNDGWFARHNIAPGTLIRTEKGTLAQTFGSGN